MCEEEAYGLSCALETFGESEEVEKFIDHLKIVINADPSTREKAYERYNFILNLYNEQPHLLDKHIDKLFEKLISLVRDANSSWSLKHETFKYMFVLIKVRGHKKIVNHFPHEVSDLELVISMIEKQNPDNRDTWYTRYVLLLWLSIVVMIPFDLTRFDGLIDESKGQVPISRRILNIIKTYIVVFDKCVDAAAFLSAKFFIRQDMKASHLSDFLMEVERLSLQDTANNYLRNGTMTSIAAILKHVKRADLLPHTKHLLKWITDKNLKNNAGANIHKLIAKIVQRIGLIFLPPRMANWRYTRGSRSLAANLSIGNKEVVRSRGESGDRLDDENETFDVPDEIEEIIDQLIQGLGNVDGVVRWSAAKGIGRVTNRLPKDLADEVVSFILQLLNPREGDAGWHGACLSLAELGRRGLLLPEHLPSVVPLVIKALFYDEPKGHASVGSHIRDAACYVCWSLARAYDCNIIEPYVVTIASALIVVTCFDREVNCRRAASAAFQENVGRQGVFPHGIDIITNADFFAVSVRNNAYLKVAPYIAQFSDYTKPLIDHLIHRKVDHWDCVIRDLTAKALHALTPYDPHYMSSNVLPILFEKANDSTLNGRHGAVLAIGQIVYAFSSLDKDTIKGLSLIDSSTLENLKIIVKTFKDNYYFRGIGGELMRQACCELIEKCSLSDLPFRGHCVIDHWLVLINECISYEVASVRDSAIKALPALLEHYFKASPCERESIVEQIDIKRVGLIENYIGIVKSTNVHWMRMGHVLALGAMPKFILQDHLTIIIETLLDACAITELTTKWAEARRDSAKALTSICKTLESKHWQDSLPEKTIDHILETLMTGLDDYTQDKRGDIGAWMREACMTALETYISCLSSRSYTGLKASIVTKALAKIAQQAVEKIDRTRALAGRVFFTLIHILTASYVPHHEELVNIIFSIDDCKDLNWNSANCTFPKFVQLLKYPEFAYNVTLGMILSIGGMTETLIKEASLSLFAFLKVEKRRKSNEEILKFCDTVYKIFQNHQKEDRISVPMLRFLDKLFDSGCIRFLVNDPSCDFLGKLFKLIQIEINGCKDVYKLVDGMNVLCQLIPVKSDTGEKVLTQLSILLCHRQPYIRRSTASRMYESLLVNGDDSRIKTENLSRVVNLLGQTNWEEPTEKLRPIRNNICDLMGVTKPVLKPKTTSAN